MAASRAGYGGDNAFLVIELTDGSIFVVSEGDPHQPALVSALDTTLANTLLLLVWHLRLLAVTCFLSCWLCTREGNIEARVSRSRRAACLSSGLHGVGARWSSIRLDLKRTSHEFGGCFLRLFPYGKRTGAFRYLIGIS